MLSEKSEAKLKVITEYLGEEEVMLQLSEECGELIQALLKYIRSTKGLTPKTVNECRDNVIEEVADVALNVHQLMVLDPKINRESVEQVQEYKTNRWFNRLFPEESAKEKKAADPFYNVHPAEIPTAPSPKKTQPDLRNAFAKLYKDKPVIRNGYIKREESEE